MSDEYARVQAAAAFVRERIPAAPGIAIVLGSGLGDFASRAADPVVLPYESVPDWPRATVIGHAGKLVVGHGAREGAWPCSRGARTSTRGTRWRTSCSPRASWGRSA